ncbi:MAG: HlyD family efflux transporter periplasmic adaptor subunit [Phycisphaerales bacterium]|nr:HlyD family efflux transporter periplasmic adaptor subunit [Phycisphaerales bacterium]
MTDTQSSTNQTHAGEKDSSPPSPADAFAEIFRLAKNVPSRQRFMTDVLRCVVRAYSSPYGAIHIRYASEVVQDETHAGPTDPKFWKSGIQQFLTQSLIEPRPWAKLLKARNGTARVAFISAPIYDPGGPAIGALAIVVAVEDDADWTAHLSTLESLCRTASFAVEFVGRSEGPAGSARGGDRALARAAAYESAEELAFALTHELRNRFGFEQVALGMVAAKHVRILSISGLDQVNGRSPGVASLRAAMEECLDAATPILHPHPADWEQKSERPPIYHLHRQWHAAAKGDSVASIPLRAGEEVVAILSVRSRSDQPLTPARVDEIRARVEPFASSLVLTQRARRSLARHAKESVRETMASLTASGRYKRKVFAAALTVATLVFCFGTMNYEIAAPCKVASAHMRHVSAPFAGVLTDAPIRQGDRVGKGEVLCEFDHRELDQQRMELAAQLEVLERERDRATAEGYPAAARLAAANQELIRVRKEIVERRIEQSVVRSPIDGVVIQGDPRKLVGAVLPQGESLFQIAPVDAWTLELSIPEWAVTDVSSGLRGSFISFARPETHREFRIARVLPAAESRQTHNVFVAEAELEAGGEWIKPGMEGVARVRVGSRPIWWVALHRVIDYARLKL